MKPTRKTTTGAQGALALLVSALVAAPNSPLVASAAAQSFGAAEAGAEAAGLAPRVPVGLAAGLTIGPTTPIGMSASLPAPSAPALSAAPAIFSAPSASAGAAAAPRAVAAAASAAVLAAAVTAPALSAEPAVAAALDAAGFSHAAGAQTVARFTARPVSAAITGGFSAERTGAALFDGAADARVFLVRPDGAPITTTLGELGRVLADHPELALALNKSGAVRFVQGNASAEALAASPEFRAKYPSALGLTEVSPLKQAWDGLIGNPLIRLVLLPYTFLRRARTPGAPARPSVGAGLAALAAAPGRAVAEVRFLGRAFADAFTRPLWSEIAGGVATKAFPLTTSLGVYWATVGLSHPLALGGLVALSLFQETFHGVFLNTWNNFQQSLSRLRGFSYQMYFNLIYMQGFGALYRALAWSAHPDKVVAPWSLAYWKDVAFMSLVGTFFGTLGYNGLNALYTKGRLKRWQRSGIQQLRDMLFLLAGPFFATGSMHLFWAVFAFQQSLDLVIALLAWRAKTRTILYVAAPPTQADAAQKALTKLGVAAPISSEKLTLEPAAGAAPH